MSSYTQYQQYGGNPYNNAPDMEGGHGSQGGYAAQGAPTNQSQGGLAPVQHEISNMSGGSQYSNSAAPGSAVRTEALDQRTFLDRVTFTKGQISGELASAMTEISTIHQRALSSPDSSSSAHLEALVAQTQLKNTQIRDSIRFLASDAAKSTGSLKNVKDRQVKQLKSEFEGQLRKYQDEELSYRQRQREQIARQYRLVNPDASDSEVKEASEMDWGNEGVFQTALKSNRTGHASTTLGAVRARHNEIQRIEMTLTELAAMFADMAQIVEAQEPMVERTEENAIKTAEDVDKGNVQIDKANEHARRRNRLKWWCLLVVVLIIIAIALGVGLGVGLAANAGRTATGQ